MDSAKLAENPNSVCLPNHVPKMPLSSVSLCLLFLNNTSADREPMDPSPAASVPPELLLEIFSHLVDDSGEFDQQSLKNCTLVSRTWSDPAQAVLWQSGATLESDKDVQKFVSTASRRRVGPKEILVYGLRDVNLLQRLWECIEGVESLVIASEGGSFSAETFNHSALAGKFCFSLFLFTQAHSS